MVRLCQNDIREAQGKSMPPEIKAKRFLEGKNRAGKRGKPRHRVSKGLFLTFSIIEPIPIVPLGQI